MASRQRSKRNQGPARRPDPVIDPDLVLDPKHGIGLRWKLYLDDADELCTVMPDRRMRKGKRVCRLRVSSCTGYDPTALHYYAELRPENPVARDARGVEHSGFLGKESPPSSAIYLSSITVERVLTAREFDSNGRLLAGVGENTSRFNSDKSARAAAIALFKKRFPPGWVLVEGDECDADDEERLHAET